MRNNTTQDTEQKSNKSAYMLLAGIAATVTIAVFAANPIAGVVLIAAESYLYKKMSDKQNQGPTSPDQNTPKTPAQNLSQEQQHRRGAKHAPSMLNDSDLKQEAAEAAKNLENVSMKDPQNITQTVHTPQNQSQQGQGRG